MRRTKPAKRFEPSWPSPMAFFGHLHWIDGSPLAEHIEPYRARLFEDSLYSFRPDGSPHYNLVLSGRAKKNWKSADLVLAAFYRFFAWPNPGDAYLLANDEDQAADDLGLAKKLIDANPILADEVKVQNRRIVKLDGKETLQILPAGDVAGTHGKTFGFVGFDEIHAYRNWAILEALQPDPTRRDTLTRITSYDGLFYRTDAPLYDLLRIGKAGDDPRMFFSWYSGDFCTDPDFAELPAEQRANPSIGSWADTGYLDQQRRRLPTHRFRRLHLNIGGQPEGAAFDADIVLAAVPKGIKERKPRPDTAYTAFVDMSGGSSDDAALAIAHKQDGRCILDLVATQSGTAPFNPRNAVSKFVRILKRYGVTAVYGDAYAGETFRQDFAEADIKYIPSDSSKSALYESLEPLLNAGEVSLLDEPKLTEQLLALVWRGRKIDHPPAEHDDVANAAAGALVTVGVARRQKSTFGVTSVGLNDGDINAALFSDAEAATYEPADDYDEWAEQWDGDVLVI